MLSRVLRTPITVDGETAEPRHPIHLDCLRLSYTPVSSFQALEPAERLLSAPSKVDRAAVESESEKVLHNGSVFRRDEERSSISVSRPKLHDSHYYLGPTD